MDMPQGCTVAVVDGETLKLFRNEGNEGQGVVAQGLWEIRKAEVHVVRMRSVQIRFWKHLFAKSGLGFVGIAPATPVVLAGDFVSRVH